jgi:DNA-binding response OmpR family regulator
MAANKGCLPAAVKLLANRDHSERELRQKLLRRYGAVRDVTVFADLEINAAERTVKKGGAPVELTMKEYELMLLLIKNSNKALSREKILELVWGYDYIGESRTVDIHIQKIRRKLGWEDCIKTVYKYGYRLEDGI